MGQSYLSPLPRFIITTNATASNKICGIVDARALGIFAGPTAFTGTIKVRVADVSGGQMRDLTSAGGDITIAAGDCLPITDVVFSQVQLVSSAAEGAKRFFNFMKRWEA